MQKRRSHHTCVDLGNNNYRNQYGVIIDLQRRILLLIGPESEEKVPIYL